MLFQRCLLFKWLVPVVIILSLNYASGQDFLTEFQTEIEQLPKDLDTLILHIQQNVSPESEPSSSIQPLRLCVPNSDDYLEIWSIINNFNDEYDNPSITIIQSSSCTENEELDKLKMWILKIRNDFNEVLKLPAWSNAYLDVKIAYEQLLTNFGKRMNETDKKVTDKGKNIITKLRTEYLSLESKIRSFFRKIQDKKRIENEKSAKLCASELKANKIDSAVKIFNEISEERIARQVIVSAYENENSFQTLFDFIQQLGDSEAVLYAYQGLMMKMASKLYWKDLNSMIFLAGLEKHKSSEFKTMTSVLEKKLKPMFEAGDYTHFYEAVNTRISESSDIGKDLMPSFVRGAYKSDTTNVIKILDMRSKFYFTRHKLYLIDSLITEMKIQDHTNKPEFFTILSDLVDMKIEVYKQTNENDKKIVNKIYENIPDNLLPLMKPNLCIQNSQTGEYMHAGKEDANGNRQILTSNEIDATFNFEAELLERGRIILLKNLRYGEYVYLIDGEAPRKVLLMKGNLKDDERAHFTIQAIGSLNVRIKNAKFNEFLFSPNENDGLVQSKNQVSEDGVWKLTTCKIVE